jgi:hypothetical protein
LWDDQGAYHKSSIGSRGSGSRGSPFHLIYKEIRMSIHTTLGLDTHREGSAGSGAGSSLSNKEIQHTYRGGTQYEVIHTALAALRSSTVAFAGLIAVTSKVLGFFVQIDSHGSESRIPMSTSNFGCGHASRRPLSNLPLVTAQLNWPERPKKAKIFVGNVEIS